MPVSLQTTLKKLDSMSDGNRVILKEYAEFLASKDHKSDRNITNLDLANLFGQVSSGVALYLYQQQRSWRF